MEAGRSKLTSVLKGHGANAAQRSTSWSTVSKDLSTLNTQPDGATHDIAAAQAAPSLSQGAACSLGPLANGAFAGRFDNGRLFLQHGPINLVVHIDATQTQREHAEAALFAAFPAWLGELVPELPRLKTAESPELPGARGALARSMVSAVGPLAHRFVTPMAAVAGAIADRAIDVITSAATVRRAWVNNGGDIAFHLHGDSQMRIGICTSDASPRFSGSLTVTGASPIRGVATSGWRGRSHSLGIADAVTVLATNAARADAAATVIASAVDTNHPGIVRTPAHDVDESSDLATSLVTVDVGPLDEATCRRALARGRAVALDAYHKRDICGAALCVQGHWELVGDLMGEPAPQEGARAPIQTRTSDLTTDARGPTAHAATTQPEGAR